MKLEQVKIANQLLADLSYVDRAIAHWKAFEFIPKDAREDFWAHLTIPSGGLSKEAMSILSASAVDYLELQRRKLRAELDEL